jgi:hypothetical protein
MTDAEAAKWRDRAEEYRVLAEFSHNAAARAAYRQLVESCMRMAAQLEADQTPPR